MVNYIINCRVLDYSHLIVPFQVFGHHRVAGSLRRRCRAADALLESRPRDVEPRKAIPRVVENHELTNKK